MTTTIETAPTTKTGGAMTSDSSQDLCFTYAWMLARGYVHYLARIPLSPFSLCAYGKNTYIYIFKTTTHVDTACPLNMTLGGDKSTCI